MPQPPITRRSLLASALYAAAVLTGCTDREEPRPAPSPTRPSPDDVVTDRVVQEKRSVLARYAATVAAHPRLAARLDPLAAEHRAHLDALGGRPPTGVPVPAPHVAATPRAAVAELADVERALAARRVGEVTAVSSTLARLLASIGAAEAVHAVRLRDAS